jgi:hypothetical protein
MLEYMCEGCLRISKDVLECSIYAKPPEHWVKQQCCPFNGGMRSEKAKAKKRVGQQKQKRKAR